MKIKGLDYNTQRERLVLPEYGREVQQMVDYCVSLKSRAERQRCANTIIAVMERMMPHTYENKDYRQKLWDHLALMSGFQLDIDYPCDITEAQKMLQKPAPMRYPMKRIPVPLRQHDVRGVRTAEKPAKWSRTHRAYTPRR